MFRPIPPRILRSTATVMECTGTDLYQKPVYALHEVTRVHLQDTNEVHRTAENTEVVLRSILFVDARISKPELDYEALFAQSLSNGGVMKIVVRGIPYTVVSVDRVSNDVDRLHHWEIGLV